MKLPPPIAAALVLACWGGPARAQERPRLRVVDGDRERSVPVATERGWAAIRVVELASLGWDVVPDARGATLTGPGGIRVELRDGTPFVRWGDEPVQLADEPYFEDGALMVPLQLVTDFLPWRLPQAYAFDGVTLTVRRPGPPVLPAPSTRSAPSSEPPGGVRPAAAPLPEPEPPRPGGDTRVIVIDAGHGGEDPGSISRGGVREKNVALGIALAMARALEGRPGLEVRLLRDDDTFIPLWERGARATTLKGDHPGVFVSVHANSFASSARGFETYFLSEARTEHERRVAAIENASPGAEAGAGAPGGDLDAILRELKNLDHQHWSSLLAQMVQEEVGDVHPGPDRGVKQGPFAVITNALMPSVLVEIGYLSHAEEARLLGSEAFQQQAGRAIARAVERFLQRYPPGAGSGAAR